MDTFIIGPCRHSCFDVIYDAHTHPADADWVCSLHYGNGCSAHRRGVNEGGAALHSASPLLVTCYAGSTPIT
eukprot:scaffold245495_cov14-Prasinocladus_malaysianus.AAC.2